MKTSKKAAVNRKSHFHGVVATTNGLTPLEAPTLDQLNKKIEATVNSGVCVYRPDPKNPDVTLIYNSQMATTVYGEDQAQFPIGWCGSTDVPDFIGASEVLRNSEPSDIDSPDAMDELLGSLQEA